MPAYNSCIMQKHTGYDVTMRYRIARPYRSRFPSFPRISRTVSNDDEILRRLTHHARSRIYPALFSASSRKNRPTEKKKEKTKKRTAICQTNPVVSLLEYCSFATRIDF